MLSVCPVMADSGFLDDEWMELWASDHQISHSNSFYSMPPIDEDYEWNMSYMAQSMSRLNRRGSVHTLPPIGEEMTLTVRAIDVCTRANMLTFVCACLCGCVFVWVVKLYTGD